MRTVVSYPRVFRVNLHHIYDALTPVLEHPSRRFIFLYFITRELSHLGFNTNIMYEPLYRNIDRVSVDEIAYLIKQKINRLFLGVYANHNVMIRPYSDFIFDITIY